MLDVAIDVILFLSLFVTVLPLYRFPPTRLPLTDKALSSTYSLHVCDELGIDCVFSHQLHGPCRHAREAQCCGNAAERERAECGGQKKRLL